AAIGCDFFIVGKREVFPVSAAIGDEHQEAILGIMAVDARGGDLALFDFLEDKGATPPEALAGLTKTLFARIPGYVPRLIAWREARLARTASPGQRGERIEDLPDADSAAAAGFKAPEFLGNRAKPVYTPEADLADITATVEALAVFRSDGSVGE